MTQPTKRYKAGTLVLTVWENKDKDDNTYNTFALSRGYKDKDGNWQNTQSLRKTDLPVASALFSQAYAQEAVSAQASESTDTEQS